MARIIAISGPSASGKTSIMEELRLRPELSHVKFVPDVFQSVWENLVDQGFFSEYDDISRDTEYLCIFIQRLIDYCNNMLEDVKSKDELVIMESCWIDVAIYAILNMWYTHSVKEVQEHLLDQLSKFRESISHMYITKYDPKLFKTERYHIPFKRYNVKYNRPLELQYYTLASHFKNTDLLLESDPHAAANEIVDDLLELGYL